MANVEPKNKRATKGAFAALKEKLEEKSDRAPRYNDDGSLTFVSETVEELPKKYKTAIKLKDSSLAHSTEITTTVISSVVITETKVTLKASNLIFQAIANWQAAQVKIKSLLSFSQIAVNISFNCNMSFPPVFENMLANLEIVNVDIFPSLGLSCRFNGFDYCDKMVATCMGPVVISGILMVAYVFVELGAKAVALQARQKIESRKEAYIVPAELEGTFEDEDIQSFKVTFATCDSDGSGTISKKELDRLVRKYEPELNDDEVEEKLVGMIGSISSGEDGEDDGEIGRFRIFRSSFKITACEILFMHLDLYMQLFSLQNLLFRVAIRPDFGEFLYAIKDAMVSGEESEFSKLATMIESGMKKSAGAGLIGAFLFLTFLVLISTSTLLFHFLKCDS
jgi:hypothetical protein